jgi:hypothetical protein
MASPYERPRHDTRNMVQLCNGIKAYDNTRTTVSLCTRMPVYAYTSNVLELHTRLLASAYAAVIPLIQGQS